MVSSPTHFYNNETIKAVFYFDCALIASVRQTGLGGLCTRVGLSTWRSDNDRSKWDVLVPPCHSRGGNIPLWEPHRGATLLPAGVVLCGPVLSYRIHECQRALEPARPSSLTHYVHVCPAVREGVNKLAFKSLCPSFYCRCFGKRRDGRPWHFPSHWSTLNNVCVHCIGKASRQYTAPM